MAATTTVTVAAYFIGKGWKVRTFKTEAAAIAWLDRNDGDISEVRWEGAA